MSAESRDDAKPVPKCLTDWSAIRDYYYKGLPKLKSPQDKDEQPRWLFRGDNACRLRPQRADMLCPLWNPEVDKLCSLAREGPGLLLPADYGVLREAFKSRLDKAFEEFQIDGCNDRHQVEWGLMRTFRRRAHLHTGRRDGDWLERLGLMAHYEAPHRMLDWGYSFFNALYFAVNSNQHKGDCIIWAINKRWLNEQAKAFEEKILEEMKGTLGCLKASRMERYRTCKSPLFDTRIIHFLMATNNMSGIYPVTPYYQNERLSIQQGTLICAGTINHTWGENLKTAMLKYPDRQPLVKIPICLAPENRREVLRELHSMNINQATLFPDLGGFAQSLRTRLADPETIKQEVPPLHCVEI